MGGHDSLISYVGIIPPEGWEEYKREHPKCCGVAEYARDPEGLQLAVEELVAKRARRKECESDPNKLHAAIKKTMMQRRQRANDNLNFKSSPSNIFGGWVKGKDKGKGKGKGKASSDDDNDDDDDDSDESDY